MKSYIDSISTIFSALALALLVAGPARSQGTIPNTWVASFGGNNSNNCTRTSPCATFAVAEEITAVGGEITCVDKGSYGRLGISFSITIDCHDASGFILSDNSTGIIINADNFQPSDVRRTVRLRNINIGGVGNGLAGIQIVGNNASGAGTTVIIEDCLIGGHFAAFNGRGIDDRRSQGGKLIVTNTTVRHNSGGGISVLPDGGSSNIQVLLNNVRSYNNGTGAQFGNLTRVVIDRSIFTGNAGAGVLTVAGAIVGVDRSTMSHNANGVQTAGGGTIALSNSNIQFNTSLGVNVSGGTVASFGNNRIAFNASPGTVPSPIGAASNNFGQN